MATKRHSLAYDLGALALKVAALALAAAALFSLVLGLMRVTDPSMEPTLQDGDLVVFYRLGTGYRPGDVVVFKNNGILTCGRVVAVGEDAVNIDSKGLVVNGSHQREPYAADETTQVADGVTFPLTVPGDALFLLGDNRDEATDSRIVGCVPTNDVYGKAVGMFRRRGF